MNEQCSVLVIVRKSRHQSSSFSGGIIKQDRDNDDVDVASHPSFDDDD